MNTLLPYDDIIKSVQCLDTKRSGKQRVEAYQILRVLAGLTKGWRGHPAVRMWRGYESTLEVYMNCCIAEWVKRGHNNKMLLCVCDEFEHEFPDFYIHGCAIDMPDWFGNPRFHSAHRAALLYKGWLDKTCELSPIRVTDIWLKKNGFPKKHELRTIDELERLQARLNVFPKLCETWYSQFGWTEEPKIEYYWPVK